VFDDSFSVPPPPPPPPQRVPVVIARDASFATGQFVNASHGSNLKIFALR